MNSFYYSIELQTVIVYGQRILFVFSSLFNIIAFFCLLKQTPEHQSKFRNYLLLIQVLAAINDINFDILVEPFPLFPALGGFCKGLVCQWSVPIQYSFATTVLLIGLIGFSIAICILYRHQSIVRGKFKLSFSAIGVVRASLLGICSAPGLISFCVLFDRSRTYEPIDSYEYGDLSWIRERGLYAMFVRSPSVTIVAVTIVSVVQISLLSQIIWFIFRDQFHLLYLVHSLIQALRSVSSRKRSQRALLILVIQLLVPIVLIILPAIIIMTSVIWETLIPFEVCQVAFFALYPHSILHSLVLLFITPSYRDLMRLTIAKLLCRKPPQKRTISVATSFAIRSSY